MSAVKIKPALIILYVLGLSLLLGLSYWQIQRGLEKQRVEEISTDTTIQHLAASPSDWQPYLYRQVQLSGVWLDEYAFMLENRVFQGQLGFEWLIPFVLSQDGSLLMVNRGWAAAQQQVDYSFLNEVQTIAGVLYQPEPGVQIGEAILTETLQTEVWPKKSLYLDIAAFTTALQQPVQKVVLVLDSHEPAALTRIWKANVISSKKHYAYAIQWLGLALTFMVYGTIWFRRRQQS